MKRKRLLFLSICTLLFFTHYSLQAQYKITGSISDDRTGEALMFANIIIQNSSKGTVTDLDGKFTLDIEDNSEVTLVVSSIGYLSQLVKAGPTNNVLNIKLREDATNLEEVVITGLASSVKRSNLANAVGSVSAKDFIKQGYPPEAVINFLMLLGWSSPIKHEFGETEREIFSLDEFVKLFE